MALVFMDSNVFIYSQIEDLPENQLASRKITELKMRGEIGVNAIIISECFYVMSKFVGNREASKRITSLLDSDSITYLSIEKTTLVKAVKLAVVQRQKINDMIKAQHVLDSKADGLLTDNIGHFKGIFGLTMYSMR